MATVFDCPKCKARLRLEGEAPPNRQLRCRKCGVIFSSNTVARTLPDAPGHGADAPPAQAPTLTAAPSAPSAPAPAPAADLTGLELGGCRIEGKLGQGGMGAVYKAHHIALDIPVAVKVLPPYLAASQPRFVERFVREARAAARLQHQNIVGVMNVGEEKGLHFIVMQYVDGETLQARIAARGRLPPAEAAHVAEQLCAALDVAQRHGIVHRDVKPDNVMIDRFGVTRLADLGLAKDLDADSRLTASGLGMGTPHYMSPEQAVNARAADHRSDLYSLGCTMYEMLTGRAPYDGDSGFAILTQHSNAPIPDAREAVPEIPEELAALVRRMMAKKPEERPQSAGEVLAELRRMTPSVGAGGNGTTPPRAVSRRASRALHVAAAVLGLLAVAAVLWHFLTPEERPPAASAQGVRPAPASVPSSAPAPSERTPARAPAPSAPAGTASKPEALPRTARVIRPEDWRATVGVEGEPHRPLPMAELQPSFVAGTLTLRHTLPGKRVSILAQQMRLDGDFDIEIEARGVSVCAIVDPRQPLNSLRVILMNPGEPEDRWRQIVIRRRGEQVTAAMDGRELPEAAIRGNRASQGFLSLTARPEGETQVRRCVITSASDPVGAPPNEPSDPANSPVRPDERPRGVEAPREGAPPRPFGPRNRPPQGP